MVKAYWNDLQPELVNYIAEKLIPGHLSDFIRFRASCCPRRSSTEEMRTQADCLYPHNWIMLSNPGPTPEPVQFFNTLTHKSFLFDLTVYLDQYSVFRTFPCVIILQNKNTQEFALLNPFMRSVTQLPSEIVSDCPEAPAKIDNMIHDNVVRASPLSDVYVTSSSTIVFWFAGYNYLVWTKPGDQSWVYAEFEIFPMRCLLNRIVIPNLDAFVDMEDSFLVDRNGTIFMVIIQEDGDDLSFEMYKLDLKKKTCVPSTDLGAYSLFLANRSFSVSSKKDQDLIPENCLYFYRKLMLDLSSNRREFWDEEPYLDPSPLVEELILFSQRVDPILLWQENGSIIYYYKDE